MVVYWPGMGYVHILGTITRARAKGYADCPIPGHMPTPGPRMGVKCPNLNYRNSRVGKKVFLQRTLKCCYQETGEQIMAGKIQQIFHDI